MLTSLISGCSNKVEHLPDESKPVDQISQYSTTLVAIDEVTALDLDENESHNQEAFSPPYTFEDATFVVNGEEIELQNRAQIDAFYHCPIFPLVETLKVLGATIEWQSDTYALITYSQKSYYLDLEIMSLCEIRQDVESEDIREYIYEIEPPGGFNKSKYFKIIEKDLLIDVAWASYFFEDALNANIAVDYVNLVITVTSK